MTDLFEDSPVYQMILEKGIEKGKEKAQQQIEVERQQVLEQFRQIVMAHIAGYFPQLTRLAKKQVYRAKDKARLQQLILVLSIPQKPETVEDLLLSLDEE